MAVSPARRVAYDILIRVERDGSYASELLNAARMDSLSREDRALCHELVMSTLRWQSELDARIAQYSSQTGFPPGSKRCAWRCGWPLSRCAIWTASPRTPRCTRAWSW